mmetsp:Transcript_7356/g.21871  ORF Transcript_7356/g.21871 Transcript_7356/m.21871 type:complete len:205 (-) Transcript_7356:107-721(-)
MGAASSSSKALNVPSLPGTAKSNKDHSSVNEFWTGVPDNRYRLGVLNCLHNLVIDASGFRIFWPSSRTTQPQAFANKASDSRLNPSYEDRTTPTVAPLTEGGDNALARNSAKGAGPFLAAVSKAAALRCKTTTLALGAQVSSSRRQCASIVVGAKTRHVRHSCLSATAPRNAATCAVFPRPISSPTTPPSLCLQRSQSQPTALL